MTKDAQYWAKKLELQAYPNGGYFREVYRAAEGIPAEALPERFTEAHCFGASIYFLLERGQVSPLHRLKADELWHFYAGEALCLHIFSPQGDYSQVLLGPDPEAGQVFQAVAPAGCWFGATIEGDYALVGCTVAPGFEASDFEPGQRAALLALYPGRAELIEQLTREVP